MSDVSSSAPLMLLGNNVTAQMMGGASPASDFSQTMQQAFANMNLFKKTTQLSDVEGSALMGDMLGLTATQSVLPQQSVAVPTKGSDSFSLAPEAEATFPGGSQFPPMTTTDESIVSNSKSTTSYSESSDSEQNNFIPDAQLESSTPTFSNSDVKSRTDNTRGLAQDVSNMAGPDDATHAGAIDLTELLPQMKFTGKHELPAHNMIQTNVQLNSNASAKKTQGDMAILTPATPNAMTPEKPFIPTLTKLKNFNLKFSSQMNKVPTTNLQPATQQTEPLPWSELTNAMPLETQSDPSSVGKISVQTPVTDPDWHEDVAKKVHMLIDKNITQAEIQVHPRDLGPVHARIKMDASGQASVVFSSEHAIVRQALEGSTEVLRDLMKQDGFDLQQVDIQHQQGEEAFNANEQNYAQSQTNSNPEEQGQSMFTFLGGGSDVDEQPIGNAQSLGAQSTSPLGHRDRSIDFYA